MAWWFGIKLWKRVFLGLALGIAFGLFVSQTMAPDQSLGLLERLKWLGDIFVTLIRLVIIPLIFFTLVAGVLALGDPKKLGTIGLKTILLYLTTTFFANLIGLAMGSIFRPGDKVDLGETAPQMLAVSSAAFSNGSPIS